MGRTLDDTDDRVWVSTKVAGYVAEHTEPEPDFTQMAINISGTLLQASLTAKEQCSTSMETNILVIHFF